MTIGDKLQALKKLHRMTYKEIAARSGIPYETVSGYLRRGRVPDVYNLIKLAEAFNVSLDVFQNCKDEPDKIS